MKLAKRIAKGTVGAAGGVTGGLLIGAMGGAMNGVQVGIPLGFPFGLVSLATGGGLPGFLAAIIQTCFWLGVIGAVVMGFFTGLFGGVAGSEWGKDEAN